MSPPWRAESIESQSTSFCSLKGVQWPAAMDQANWQAESSVSQATSCCSLKSDQFPVAMDCEAVVHDPTSASRIDRVAIDELLLAQR